MNKVSCLVVIVMLIVGCQDWSLSKLKRIGTFPSDRSKLHPWFASLMNQDAETIAKKIQQRLTTDASTDLAPLIEHTALFVPHRVCCRNEIGYIACVKRESRDKKMLRPSDLLMIAQPLSDEVVRQRCDDFDETIRPLMHEFLSKFAGFGEDMEINFAGQFVLDKWRHAKEVVTGESSSLAEWADAIVIYSAYDGDSLMINKHGATAWYVAETKQVMPLFDTFPEFIRHYVALRQRPHQINSLRSADLLGVQP